MIDAALTQDMPAPVQQDLEHILDILKRYGARRIILYGSYARGTASPGSDLDLCEEGIPAASYFRAWAECLMTTNTPMSILDLSAVRGYLRDRILREGKVLYALG